MMERVEFECTSLKNEIISDEFLNAQLFALGHTLTDMGKQIGEIVSTRIGNYILLYFEEKGTMFEKDDPVDSIISLWEFYISKGLVEKVKIEYDKEKKEMIIHEQGIFGSKAFHKLYKDRGEEEHVRPCLLLATIRAIVHRFGFTLDVRKQTYDEKRDKWFTDIKLVEREHEIDFSKKQ